MIRRIVFSWHGGYKSKQEWRRRRRQRRRRWRRRRWWWWWFYSPQIIPLVSTLSKIASLAVRDWNVRHSDTSMCLSVHLDPVLSALKLLLAGTTGALLTLLFYSSCQFPRRLSASVSLGVEQKRLELLFRSWQAYSAIAPQRDRQINIKTLEASSIAVSTRDGTQAIKLISSS